MRSQSRLDWMPEIVGKLTYVPQLTACEKSVLLSVVFAGEAESLGELGVDI